MAARLRAIDGDARIIEHQRLHYAPGEDPRKHFDKFKLGTPSAFCKIVTPLGFFHEAAGKSFGYNIELVKSLHRDLMTNRISGPTVDGLYLMGVKFVIFRDRYRYFSPPLPASAEFILRDEVLTLEHTTPLIFSTRVITTKEVEGFDLDNAIDARRYFDPETYDYSGRLFRELVVPLLETMAIDKERGVAKRLVARESGLEGTPLDPEDLDAEVRDVEITLDRTTVRYWSNAESVGQLSMNYFPYLDVSVDGVPVEFHASAVNTLLVPLPGGEHVLTVRGVASPLSRRTFWFSAGFVGLLLMLPGSLFRTSRPGADG